MSEGTFCRVEVHIYIHTHGNKSGNTFSSLKRFEKKKKHFSFFSGDTDFFITYITYLGLATGQFMEVHNILSKMRLMIDISPLRKLAHALLSDCFSCKK